MTDFNEFVEAFADLVAAKVATRLQTPTYTITPNTNTNSTTSYLNGGQVTTYNPVVETKVDPEPTTTVSNKDARIDELNRVDIRTLRKNVAVVEGKEPSDYTQKKPELVRYIADLEAVIGRSLEDEIERMGETEIPDDTDVEEEAVADDKEPEELTREMALGLDLAELKSIAVSNDVDPKTLKGLDVEAVVELIFGEEAVEDDSDEESEPESEDEEYTVEQIEVMSIGELRELATSLNEQGAELEFDRNTSHEDLLAAILELAEED